MNLKIRTASQKDSEFVYQTKKAAFSEYIDMLWGWMDASQRKLHDERFATQRFEIIEYNGIDVGYFSADRSDERIKLNQLFLLPEYQGSGIGAEVMSLIDTEAIKKGASIELQVLKVNPRALRFYKRLGFQPCGESETHVLMNKTHLGE